jgi:4-aminobutyrate aminotransferase-like enzyme
MDSQELRDKQKEYLFPCISTYYSEPLVIQTGSGHRVSDAAGRSYLDFFGGILTVIAGHCRQEITEAICAQAHKLQHVSTLYITEPQVALAERMARITPGRIRKSFFTNSGTEANETAIALARAFTGNHEVIALRHSYSGRSNLAVSLTGNFAWRNPMAVDFSIRHTHNAYCYRCALGRRYPECGLACAADLEELIRTTTCGKIAALIAEPIQGVGGFITPPNEYFPMLAGIARKYGGLFIADEVQTGFGRTGGKWFGIEHWGVEPDIITCAKGMANGFPIGATAATPEVADAFRTLTISTFGGSPVQAAAASATIDYIATHNLLENAATQGAYLRSRLEALQPSYPAIGEVRGMGLMQGVELVEPDGSPSPGRMSRLMEATRRHGLLIGKGGLYGNAVRISPSLDIAAEEIDEAMQIFERSLSETA